MATVQESEVALSVAELSRVLQHVVEEVSASVWVQGEISQLKLATSGHAYFLLKDEHEDAVLECVLYRWNALRARRYLKDGACVQLQGRGTVWAPRGRLQFVGERVRPVGRGALLEALEKLKLRLAQEGLFAPERKRPLPAEPRIVGVVTSSSGAAFHDIRSVAFRRGAVRLVLSAARVQGEGAVASLLRALERIEKYPGMDVVILGRGGGSAEDLMAFNDERIVRCVAALRIPVVSAVGHEIDVSLTDLAADARAATPSQAAEIVVPDGSARRAALVRAGRAVGQAMQTRLAQACLELTRLRTRLTDPRFLIATRQQELDELGFRLRTACEARLGRHRVRAAMLVQRLHRKHPQAVLARSLSELAPLEIRLRNAQETLIRNAAARLRAEVGRLHAFSPLAVLSRGYAIALSETGRAVRSARDVRRGDKLEIRVSQGRIWARVSDSSVDVEASLPAELEPGV